MKTFLVALVCLFGIAMAGISAQADNPAPAATPTPAQGKEWCVQHQQECRQHRQKAEQWCAKHQQECKEHMQKRAEWCKQNQEKCRDMMREHRAEIEAFCKQHPKNERCERLKQHMQNMNGSMPKAGPPPGV